MSENPYLGDLDRQDPAEALGRKESDEVRYSRGKRIARKSARLLFGVNAAWSALALYTGGLTTAPGVVVVFLLVSALAYFLEKGRRWARWLVVLLNPLLGVAIAVPLMQRGFSIQPLLIALWLIALSLLGSAVLLAFSGGVGEYFKQPSQAPQRETSDNDLA